MEQSSESNIIDKSSEHTTNDLSQVGKSKTKKRKSFKFICSFCKYTSNRKFNIIRHEKRIHETMKKVRICCGNKYNTKWGYYQHCECVHPHTRSKATISRKLYQVGCTSNNHEDKELTNEEKEDNERSENLNQKDICTDTLPYSSCTPEHNSHIKEDTHLQEKEFPDSEKQSLQINFSSIDDLNTLTELQKLYLEDIDFDSFPKL